MSIASKAPRKPRAKKQTEEVLAAAPSSIMFSLDEAPQSSAFIGSVEACSGSVEACSGSVEASSHLLDAVGGSTRAAKGSTRASKGPVDANRQPVYSNSHPVDANSHPVDVTLVASLAGQLPEEPVMRQVDVKLVDLARSVQVIEWMQMIAQKPAEPVVVRWTPLCWGRLDDIPPKQILPCLPLDTYE